jgi:hypothetical protein
MAAGPAGTAVQGMSKLMPLGKSLIENRFGGLNTPPPQEIAQKLSGLPGYALGGVANLAGNVAHKVTRREKTPQGITETITEEKPNIPNVPGINQQPMQETPLSDIQSRMQPVQQGQGQVPQIPVEIQNLIDMYGPQPSDRILQGAAMMIPALGGQPMSIPELPGQSLKDTLISKYAESVIPPSPLEKARMDYYAAQANKANTPTIDNIIDEAVNSALQEEKPDEAALLEEYKTTTDPIRLEQIQVELLKRGYAFE